ncbi:autotransporter outer membrane beta-barrel domain-containing protein [Helicobacter sp. 11S03491-1]|uniref:autotransporter outer membrane beta-barrel domain-containing protein n=1 Tax=Helicobacter sp. 11S03491-1 TaxID=1476196 RepID=UPI000BD964F9|nr:autotransporter outer membrane beta-barrel domain-containing protein [Helicobacter sp. 11S03491-1]PAF43363.1 hypothetical protein BKH45_01610 [Helicobacter sp. 11S03491-1]
MRSISFIRIILIINSIILSAYGDTQPTSSVDICASSKSGYCNQVKEFGYADKASGYEKIFVDSGKNGTLSIPSISTTLHVYTFPTQDGSIPKSSLEITNDRIQISHSSNKLYETNVVGPYSELTLKSKPNTTNSIRDISIGILSRYQSPLALNLANQYLQAAKLTLEVKADSSAPVSDSAENSEFKIQGRLYIGNGSTLSLITDHKLTFSAKMKSEIAYPKTKYYFDNEYSNKNYPSSFYQSYDDFKILQEQVGLIAQNTTLNFQNKSFINIGELYISQGASKANIVVETPADETESIVYNFSNGDTLKRATLLEHNAQNMIKAINNPLEKNALGFQNFFTDASTWREGRISVFDYGKLSITGNVHNHQNGTIILIDGGILQINGNFKNEGWIFSGAIDSNDFGYISVSKKGILTDKSQIGLIANKDNSIMNNRAYLILRTQEGISFTQSETPPQPSVSNDQDSSSPEVSPSPTTTPPLLPTDNIHLFGATKINGSLAQFDQDYTNNNLKFEAKLENENKDLYILVRPSETSKQKSVETLMNEAKSALLSQEKITQLQQKFAGAKVALTKAQQALSIHDGELQEYKQLLGEEFFKEKNAAIDAKIALLKSQEAELKIKNDTKIAQRDAELNATTDAAEKSKIRTKYYNDEDIKNYEDKKRELQNIQWLQDDLKGALPKAEDKEKQNQKLAKLEEFNATFKASEVYKTLLNTRLEKQKTYKQEGLALLKGIVDELKNKTLSQQNFPSMTSGEYSELKNKYTHKLQEINQKMAALSTDDPDEIQQLNQLLDEALILNSQKTKMILNILNKSGIQGLSANELSTLNALKNISDDLATYIITHANNDVALTQLTQEAKNDRDHLSKQTQNNSISKTINLISSTLSQNRLTNLSNPFNPTSSFAKMIQKISKNKYAQDQSIQTDAVDSFLSLQEPDTLEEENNMDLWGSLIGAYANASGNAMIYGGTIGYDSLITESAILGVYGSYAYAKSNNQGDIKTQSHNAQLGIYSRIFSHHSEFDIFVSHNMGFVNQDRVMTILDLNSLQTSNYINHSTQAGLNYGYVFGIQAEKTNFYIKPQLGISALYNIQGNYKEKGLAFEVKGSSNFILNTALALEFRKYFKNGGYFYIIPGLDYMAYNSQKNITYIMGGIEIKSPLNSGGKLYYSTLAGAEFKFSAHIFGFGSLGIKIAGNEQYYNGQAGMRYKF